MIGIHMIGLGKAVPKKVVSNDEISQMVDTSDDWITSRTGIHSRHIATTETTTDLAAKAAKVALEEAHIQADTIELVIVATVSPDLSMPSTACTVAHILGIKHAACFDLSAACSGFIYSSQVAFSLMQTVGYKRALVIGAEVLSKAVDWQDRGTCILFADGAGAAIYELGAENQILGIEVGSDPSGAQMITLPVGDQPHDFYQVDSDARRIKMDGRSVYAFATTKVPESIQKVLEQTGYEADAVDYYILHQANGRIMDSVARKLGVDSKKFYKNLQHYGNTSAASIPMALYDLKDSLKKGDKIMLSGFGAGLTWGTMFMKWL